MRPEELEAFVRKNEEERIKLLLKKGADYARGYDHLANFKRMSILAEVLDIDVRRSPGDCARFLVLLKLDRWCNLLSQGLSPKNESVQDSLLDLHNYIDLAAACDNDGGFRRGTRQPGEGSAPR